jgi:hypothetical protein
MSSFQRAQKIYDAIWQYSSDDVSPDTVRRLISMAVRRRWLTTGSHGPSSFPEPRAGRGKRDSVFRVRTGGRPTAAWKILGTARRD